MNHFGVAIGAIAATVIGGAVVLDRMTKDDQPSRPVVASQQPRSAPETQLASANGAGVPAPTSADVPVDPLQVRKMSSPAPDVSAPAKTKAAASTSAPSSSEASSSTSANTTQ